MIGSSTQRLVGINAALVQLTPRRGWEDHLRARRISMGSRTLYWGIRVVLSRRCLALDVFGDHFRNLSQKCTFAKKVTGAGGFGGVLEGENVGRQALFPLWRKVIPKQQNEQGNLCFTPTLPFSDFRSASEIGKSFRNQWNSCRFWRPGMYFSTRKSTFQLEGLFTRFEPYQLVARGLPGDRVCSS